jgi:molybdopterin-guanine dinucleotide biosynthesis protein A
MGRDKALLPWEGQTLLEYTEQRLKPMVSTLVVSSNQIEQLSMLTSSPILPDEHLDQQLSAYSGPLHGVLTGLMWMQTHTPECEWLLSVAVDTPSFPLTLGDDLLATATNQNLRLVCAASKDKLHPTCALWHSSLRQSLADYLLRGERRLMTFHEQMKGGHVSYGTAPQDPFFNINTEDDLEQLKRI